ncbi:hypothetical protein N7465_005997 [Penicillium sp. CMV-2018d]|nr:hypothetical protein N7465_005997 [Penicillium sp. CMV-2018d]
MHIPTPRQGSPAIAATENSGGATGFGMGRSAPPEDNTKTTRRQHEDNTKTTRRQHEDNPKITRRQPLEPSKVGNKLHSRLSATGTR